MEGYAVVKFPTEEDTVDVVPMNWLNEELRICQYPELSKKEKLLRNKASPDDSWSLFSIEILGKYESYTNARKKLRLAEDTSNLSSGDENENNGMQKRKRTKKSTELPGEESSDDNMPTVFTESTKDQGCVVLDMEEYLTAGVSSPKIKHTETNSFLQVSNDRYNNESSRVSSPMLKHTATNSFLRVSNQNDRDEYPLNSLKNICSPSNSSRNHNSPKIPNSPQGSTQNINVILGYMQTMIAELSHEVKSMHTKLDELLTNAQVKQVESATEVQELALFGSLPIHNELMMVEMEEKLDSPSFQTQMLKLLMSTGGKDVKTWLYATLRRLITNELAEQYSYSGVVARVGAIKNKKKAFKSTRLLRLLHVAASKLFKTATEVDIKSAVCSWLQQAKSRMNPSK